MYDFLGAIMVAVLYDYSVVTKIKLICTVVPTGVDIHYILGYFFCAKSSILSVGAAATTHLEVGAFIRSAPGIEWPDIQYHFLPSVVIDHGQQMGHCHAFQVIAWSHSLLGDSCMQVAL